MSLKILIDMNLSADWVPLLQNAGWSATHWSTAGDPRAADRAIMDWATANGYVVFAHDLDFGTMLAAIRQHEADLEAGAVVVVDERKSRVRILPIS